MRNLLAFRICYISCVVFTLLPSAYGQMNGYIGIYSDPAGTQPCRTVPPNTAATLHVFATTMGATTAGIRGAEFRVSVSTPSGWLLSFTPAANANVVLGNPIDTDPAPNAGGGVSLGFPQCQEGVLDKVPLGTISVFNLSAG